MHISDYVFTTLLVHYLHLHSCQLKIQLIQFLQLGNMFVELLQFQVHQLLHTRVLELMRSQLKFGYADLRFAVQTGTWFNN